ncbi:MAG: 5'-methylthioadenosine/S-adenosylhomocysteine nucleosidase [Tildeniella nuda ZEHNDER 1965/U140]|jgi:adenosylhomocysteine nucleosidase|nr:5'-methylthioadenosine/S-adenosylhomocysteine nucleosidase [Tildeniella nuda ZEHNDER 1965/U140]
MSVSRIKRIFIIALLCLVMTIAQVSAKETKQKRCLTECKSRLGIVSAFGEEAAILLAETTSKREYKINGNIFTTGNLRGNRIVIVLSGISIENATMITQLMVDNFNINHLLLSGIAGGIDPDNKIGDVVIPSKWAFPLEVYWNGDSNLPAPCGTPGDLLCLGLKLSEFTSTPNSDYQVPTPGGAVGTGLFMRDTFVRSDSNFPDGEFKFDYKVDPEMLAVAKSVNVQLDQCGTRNPNLCVSVQPVVRVGGRGVAGPAFLANPNYRDYLFKTIKAVSVDMETTALAHVAYANEIPFIAFRSLSDLAGGDDFTDVGAFFGSGLAEGNESKVTLGFLEAWAKKHSNS